ncbi:MAG: hypothetical protein AAGA46_00310 [Cyanobacteria bacterium P01_F01_bin.13]
MVAISGAGGGLIRTEAELIIPKLQDFTLNRSPSTTELFRRPTCGNGLAATHAEIENQVTWQADLTGPAFDGTILSLFMDQRPTLNTAVVVPTLICTTVTSAANTVTVTGLTIDQPVRAAYESTYNQEQLVQVTGVPAAANEYQVTANTVTFFAPAAGDDKAARITYTSSETIAKFIGGPAALNPYGARELIFSVQGLEGGDLPWIGWAQSATPTGDRSLGTANDTIDSSYKLATPSNWNTPILWFQKSDFFQNV